MLEAVKVALDPTPCQQRMMASHAGAARFTYNAGLSHIKNELDHGETVEFSYYGLRKWWNANKNTLAPWWAENSKEAYNTGLEALACALSNWAKSRNGKRRGRPARFPRFKTRNRAVPRFAYTTGTFGVIDGDPCGLRLPRIGRVHCMENVSRRVGDARVMRMTVSYRGGRWHASLTVERPDTVPTPPAGGSVGVDLGVRTLATLSDGHTVENPGAHTKNLARLRKASKSLSRKKKGSNRYRRARKRLAAVHARIANVRLDAEHKLTTRLARTYSDISIEDLNVAGMVKNRRLARVVEDASFARVRHQLEYKTARTGSQLHVVDRWFPSSKMCSGCKAVKAKLPLSQRTYCCNVCGLRIDRDVNAAINILVAGSAPETINARGAGVSRPGMCRATHSAVKREPGVGTCRTRPGADLGNEVIQPAALN